MTVERPEPDPRGERPADTDPPGGTWSPTLLALYEEHWLALTRLAYLLTGNRAVAEELVQDVFLRGSRKDWDVIAKPVAYLRRAVLNATRDWGRRVQVADRHLPRSVEHAVDHPDELWDVLGRLHPDRRQVVVLHYYEDLSAEAIAELLDCPAATVRSRLHRALKDLRREVQP